MDGNLIYRLVDQDDAVIQTADNIPDLVAITKLESFCAGTVFWIEALQKDGSWQKIASS